MRLEKAETTNSKPDVNLLEEWMKPTVPKREDRILRSQKARKHRAEVKQLRQGRIINKG